MPISDLNVICKTSWLILIDSVSEEEVFESIKVVDPYKAPRSDKFSASFCQKRCQIIKIDFMAMVKEFEGHRESVKLLNSCSLVLPKKENVVDLKDLRPITLKLLYGYG